MYSHNFQSPKKQKNQGLTFDVHMRTIYDKSI